MPRTILRFYKRAQGPCLTVPLLKYALILHYFCQLSQIFGILVEDIFDRKASPLEGHEPTRREHRFEKSGYP